jgi:hypothetical protein
MRERIFSGVLSLILDNDALQHRGKTVSIKLPGSPSFHCFIELSNSDVARAIPMKPRVSDAA